MRQELEQLYIPPMAGVTDLVFRRLVRHVLGNDLSNKVRLSTEMISSKGMMYQDSPHRMRLTDDEKGKVVIQLFGHEPEVMAAAARTAEKAGAASIDINMGCPVPKITNGKDGAALMKEPCLAVDIVKETIAAVDIPVSVKTRLGWNEEQKNVRELSLRLQDAGISSITIHGRTRKQAYTGTADWNEITKVREILEIPVYANGDIDSSDRAEQALNVTGAHGVAVARAAIGNPWLIKSIAMRFAGVSTQEIEPTLLERIEVLKTHLNWAYDDKGERGVKPLKRHIGKYISGFPNASDWRKRIVTSETYESMNNQINEMLNSL